MKENKLPLTWRLAVKKSVARTLVLTGIALFGSGLGTVPPDAVSVNFHTIFSPFSAEAQGLGCHGCNNYWDMEWGGYIHQDSESLYQDYTVYAYPAHLAPNYGGGRCCEAHDCQSPGDWCMPILTFGIPLPCAAYEVAEVGVGPSVSLPGEPSESAGSDARPGLTSLSPVGVP